MTKRLEQFLPAALVCAAVPAVVDVEPKEVQKVVMDASCKEHAMLGDDEVCAGWCCWFELTVGLVITMN